MTEDGVFAIFEIDNREITYFLSNELVAKNLADLFKTEHIYDELPMTCRIVTGGGRMLKFEQMDTSGGIENLRLTVNVYTNEMLS